MHQPTSVAEISAAVAAAAAGGARVRTRGSGHSFTSIAATDEHAIDLSGWRGFTDINLAEGLVTVRAGTTLAELNAALDGIGLALVNMGDIDKQTISGAISTGTHGTGARLGGLATQVAALELVLADGSVVTCSPDERPDLFAAARVGLGALGVISTVTLQCVPSFVLHAHEAPEPIDDVLERFDENADENDHFELFWFFYGTKALVKRNNRLPAGTAARPLSKARQYLEYEIMETRALNVLFKTGKAIPRLAKPLIRGVSAGLSERDYSDVSHRVFVTPRNVVRFVESEYAVPRADAVHVVNELRSVAADLDYPVLFPIEVRVAAADDIWLSTAYQRDVAYIAVHQSVGMPYQEYFAAFESIAGSVGGRPHWGKMHTLDASVLRTRYPRFDDFLAVRAEVDPDGRFGNAYTDRVLGRP